MHVFQRHPSTNLPRLVCVNHLSIWIQLPNIQQFISSLTTWSLFLIGAQHVRYQPRLRVALMMTSPPDTADPFRFGRSSLISRNSLFRSHLIFASLFSSPAWVHLAFYLWVSFDPLFGDDSVWFLCLPWAAEPPQTSPIPASSIHLDLNHFCRRQFTHILFLAIEILPIILDDTSNSQWCPAKHGFTCCRCWSTPSTSSSRCSSRLCTVISSGESFQSYVPNNYFGFTHTAEYKLTFLLFFFL